MVARNELVRIASRYDTTMSRAMLRALGTKRVKSRDAGKYAGIRWCFRNRVNPVDARAARNSHG